CSFRAAGLPGPWVSTGMVWPAPDGAPVGGGPIVGASADGPPAGNCSARPVALIEGPSGLMLTSPGSRPWASVAVWSEAPSAAAKFGGTGWPVTRSQAAFAAWAWAGVPY